MPSPLHGNLVPHIVAQKEIEEAKEKAMLKRQNRHDWRVAIVGGAIGGIIAFLMGLLIEKLPIIISMLSQ